MECDNRMDINVEDVAPDEGLSVEEQAEESIEREERRKRLEEALSHMTPRTQQVLRLRYGLDDGQPRTLEEVAKVFGVTRERIRQIEARAFRRPGCKRSKRLKDYLN